MKFEQKKVNRNKKSFGIWLHETTLRETRCVNIYEIVDKTKKEKKQWINMIFVMARFRVYSCGTWFDTSSVTVPVRFRSVGKVHIEFFFVTSPKYWYFCSANICQILQRKGFVAGLLCLKYFIRFFCFFGWSRSQLQIQAPVSLKKGRLRLHNTGWNFFWSIADPANLSPLDSVDLVSLSLFVITYLYLLSFSDLLQILLISRL